MQSPTNPSCFFNNNEAHRWHRPSTMHLVISPDIAQCKSSQTDINSSLMTMQSLISQAPINGFIDSAPVQRISTLELERHLLFDNFLRLDCAE
ncbi:hypothetical protein NDU88_010374 [Pleurodeles waltl]|uniref:Uncharacterized protein n=1 Tax=Pleurodeles waltl TaxID=8319 RepID=A0AAV7QU85_PLEWA|nr:hypothetical protein NDU88_010374 [Pleurodeles waltl]